jgi:hypothetical protein
MEQAIIAKLLATGSVAAIVGTRVFPGSRPQASALPALVFNRISGAPVYTDDGEAGLAESRIQIDCWAETYSVSKALASAVKASLSGFVGASSGVTVQNILIITERDRRESGSNAPEYLYRVNLEFSVWHET